MTIGQVCVQGPLHWKRLKSIISIAAHLKDTFSIMHLVESRAYFRAKAQRPVPVRLPTKHRVGADVGKIGVLKKSMYDTRDAASNWECDWQEHVKSRGFRLGLSSKNLFYLKKHQIPGMAHDDDFVLTGPTERLAEFKGNMTGVSHQSKHHQPRITRKHENAEQKVAQGKARNCITARSQTCRANASNALGDRKRGRTVGPTQWRRLRAHGTDSTTGRIQGHYDRCIPSKQHHQSRIITEHHSAEQKVALGKARNCIPARPQTW